MSKVQKSKKTHNENPSAQACGFLLMDKPVGITSFRLIGPIKYHFKPAKTGHAGTLDQDARGLMIVAVGRASRLLQYAEGAHKTYEFTLHLGRETVSAEYFHQEVLQDIEGQTLTTTELLKLLPIFTGKIKQTPPQYSAVKVDGKRASDRARAGEEVLLKSREIEILSLEVIDEDALNSPEEPRASFRLKCHCSKGTYIRSLVVDLAKEANLLGAVSDIYRTQIGSWKIEDAHSLQDFRDQAASFEDAEGVVDKESKLIELSKFLTPPHEFFPEWPLAVAGEAAEAKFTQGMKQRQDFVKSMIKIDKKNLESNDTAAKDSMNTDPLNAIVKFDANQWKSKPGFILNQAGELICMAQTVDDQLTPKIVFK